MWLEALIWPGEEEQIPRLRAALEIARRDPPPVQRSGSDQERRWRSSAPGGIGRGHHAASLRGCHDTGAPRSTGAPMSDPYSAQEPS
ncbi:DUF2332 family protein [Amycolatopsis pithecellobii]|uniref:DUF2332 family protein n=1 Tax=Amycolatopsis pithecellobii TaxID=664692 RepID=UPI0035E4158D